MSLINQRALPSILYKYVKLGDFVEDLLTGQSIKFTKPSEFNDPFDCAPAILIPNRKAGNDLLSKLPIPLGLTSRQRRLVRRNAKRNIVGKLLTPEIQTSNGNLLENTGVCSLSEQDNNILMWSHYADQHKGICLGFDTSKHFFQTAWPVIYQTNYPIVVRPHDSDIDVLKKTILVKSSEWEYEQEWRIIRRTLSTEESYIKRLQYEGTLDSDVFLDQRGPGFYKFPKESITQIIFGLKTPNLEKQKILKILEVHHLSPKVFQLKKHESKFELVKHPIKTKRS